MVTPDPDDINAFGPAFSAIQRPTAWATSSPTAWATSHPDWAKSHLTLNNGKRLLSPDPHSRRCCRPRYPWVPGERWAREWAWHTWTVAPPSSSVWEWGSPDRGAARSPCVQGQEGMKLNLVYYSSGPVVMKKTMSPCSIWQGLWAAAQKRRCLWVHKRTRVP